MGKKISVIFSARPCFDTFTPKIFEYIRDNIDKEAEGHFIVANYKEADHVKNVIDQKNVHIYNVTEYFKQHWEEFTFEDLCEKEETYSCKPIWSYIYIDRFLIKHSREYAIKITDGYFQFYEDLFKGGEINFFYDEAISTIQTFVGYLVGKKYDVKYFSAMQTRGSLDLKYFYFLNDPFQLDMEMDDDYLNVSYSKEEIEKADAFLKENEESYQKPLVDAFNVVQKPHFNLYDFLMAPLHYAKCHRSFDYNNKYFYMYYHEDMVSQKTFDVKYYFNYKKYRDLYQKPDYSKKFVYYPLHFEPEASTLVCANKFEKQIVFIDGLAKSLPADTLLYVKEHYVFLGNRNPSFYESMKNYPNVVLIDPFESSRTLIENSVAVATLTGTAGYEAMLLRKPVILGGRIFFENAPGIIHVDDIYHKYTDIMDKWEKPKREDVVKFICAFFRTLHEGNIAAFSDTAFDKENMKLIATALYEKMQEI